MGDDVIQVNLIVAVDLTVPNTQLENVKFVGPNE
jgi:hypothetical protein